jgi:hypothetical protein
MGNFLAIFWPMPGHAFNTCVCAKNSRNLNFCGELQKFDPKGMITILIQGVPIDLPAPTSRTPAVRHRRLILFPLPNQLYKLNRSEFTDPIRSAKH